MSKGVRVFNNNKKCVGNNCIDAFRSSVRVVAALTMLACVARAPAAPLDAYGRLPSIEQASLSPDGTKIALVQTAHDVRVLSIVDLDEEKVISLLRIGDSKVPSIEWADDDHLLVTTASSVMPMELFGEKTEWHLLSVFNVQTKKFTALLNHVNDDAKTMNVVNGAPVIVHSGKDTLLYVHGVYVTDVTETALFRINLTTGTEALIRKGGIATNGWLIDDSGEIVAEQDYSEHDRRWSIRLYDGRHLLHTVSGVAPIDSPDMLGLNASGDEIVVALTEADGVNWRPLSIKEGTWGADLAPNESLNEFLLQPGSQRMIGTGYVGDETRYHFIDKSLQAGWDWTVRVFGFQRVELISISADHSRFLVQVQGPKSGYAYYLSDIKEHLTKSIGPVYAGVTQVAEMRAIKYKAADGLEIPAYLTLPPDRPAKNLPVIVFPHGGPEARDNLGFDWWAQAMAMQGYAVLQPNYRGSSLGKKFVEAGYGQWGRKMQTDLSDGLNDLATQGIIDPRRACIVGASYGGYAALAGVTLQSGVYRCAVAVSAVSDPANFMRWVGRKESYGDKTGQRYWERFLGVEDPGDKRLDEISPLRHIDQLTVPMMLIHGRDDTTVPYDQSVDVAKAMKKAGRTVEFVTLDKEDHYFSRSATRLQMLQSSMDFLKKYNPAD
jgi:dipeptidyl aminopeptidase/acylaminoacyl peptidase